MAHNTEIYSQCGEIQILVELGLIKEKGFYLDVGSADAFKNSNTAYLDKIGWEGICVEPNPEYLKSYERRNCQLIQKAVNTFTGQCTFDFNGEIGKVGGEQIVECIRLDKITDRQIDLLSLDIEGMEFEVFSTCPLKPDILIFEYNTLGVIDARLKDLIEWSELYKHIATTAFNHIYKKI